MCTTHLGADDQLPVTEMLKGCCVTDVRTGGKAAGLVGRRRRRRKKRRKEEQELDEKKRSSSNRRKIQRGK